MRSTDFSAGPRQAQAEAVFVGLNGFSGPVPMITQILRWPRVVRQLRAAPGYCWHHSYWVRPWSIGLLIGYTSHAELTAFARTPIHRDLVRWMLTAPPRTGRRPADAGFIRFYTSDPSGYTNGRWRAEDDQPGAR